MDLGMASFFAVAREVDGQARHAKGSNYISKPALVRALIFYTDLHGHIYWPTRWLTGPEHHRQCVKVGPKKWVGIMPVFHM